MLYKQKGFKEKYLIQNKLIIYVSFNVLYTRKNYLTQNSIPMYL